MDLEILERSTSLDYRVENLKSNSERSESWRPYFVLSVMKIINPTD